MEQAQQTDKHTVPDKALKLARRVAGLQRKEARRYRFEVTMLPDGTWYLTIGDSEEMEYLGQN